jgi:eukaryotic-like serine/threonine-protein kinase
VQVRHSRPPDSLGKYRIVERMSENLVAEVYKARVDGLAGFHRTFVVKRFHEALMRDEAFATALVDEAKLAGLLSHANIVQILDLGEAGGTTYIAMELVDGFDLDRILTRARDRGIAIPDSHAVQIAIEVLKALEYAHHRQVMRGGTLVPLDIVHRDVSPSNILVSRQGEVKLGDFGIARATRPVLAASPPDDLYDFLSPEQLEGERARIDRRSDLFATGTVLYELLAGHHPFARPGRDETAAAIRSGAFPRLRNVPDPLARIVARALAVDPADRYPDATAMKDALDGFAHDAGSLSGHTTLAAFLGELFPPGRAIEVAPHERRLAMGESERTMRTVPSRRTPPTVKPTPESDRSSRIGWLAAGALAAALLVLLGAVAYGRLAGSPGVGAHKPPELQIQAPPGAVAHLDDRALPGSSPWNVPLTARTEYVVRVEMAGYYPVETAIRLEEDDIRVLAFQLEDLRAEKRE